jgi:hypothetical protein
LKVTAQGADCALIGFLNLVLAQLPNHSCTFSTSQ